MEEKLKSEPKALFSLMDTCAMNPEVDTMDSSSDPFLAWMKSEGFITVRTKRSRGLSTTKNLWVIHHWVREFYEELYPANAKSVFSV